MIVNTRRLFGSLLSRMRISTICDVGSMDGADALAFRAAASESSIYAFEPNPGNLQRMQADSHLRDGRIEIVPAAAADNDGEADFFLGATEYRARDPRSGLSSLYRRSEWPPVGVARVTTLRLDTFLSARCPPDARVALWIDVEGKAYEAIAGTRALSHRVLLIHVEVETEPLIGSDQKLYAQVRELLQSLGFIELATDQVRNLVQFNALYVRRDLTAGVKIRIWTCLVRARLRYLAWRIAATLCPACLRTYRSMRDGMLFGRK
jgi:FkbM family methyltransferase